MTQAGQKIREELVEILDEVLPEGLPRPWPDQRPLVEAGLDSVGVLTLVGELEARMGLNLGDTELTEETLATLSGLLALAGRSMDGESA